VNRVSSVNTLKHEKCNLFFASWFSGALVVLEHGRTDQIKYIVKQQPASQALAASVSFMQALYSV
jgi:hypothetical protein